MKIGQRIYFINVNVAAKMGASGPIAFFPGTFCDGRTDFTMTLHFTTVETVYTKTVAEYIELVSRN